MKKNLLIIIGILQVVFYNLYSSVIYKSSNTFNTGNTDTSYGVTIDDKNYIYFCGDDTGDWKIYKTSANLSYVNDVTFNSGGIDYANDIITDNSFIYVLGYFPNAGYKILLIKYDLNLNLISSTTYDNSMGYGINFDKSGDILVCGLDCSPDPDAFLLLKYDKNLNLIAKTTYYSNGQPAKSVDVDSNGYIYVTGYYYDKDEKNNDFLTVKFDSDLNYISHDIIDTPAYAYSEDIVF